MKKRKPRAGTHPFLVTGPVQNFPHKIREWTSAVSEAQALKQVAKRLEKKWKVPIYLGNCRVIKVERNEGEKEKIMPAQAP